MPVPDEFRSAWNIKKPSAGRAYKRLEEICENYHEGKQIFHNKNNIPYLVHMLKNQGFLEFDTNLVLETTKVIPTEKALEIYNQNVP